MWQPKDNSALGFGFGPRNSDGTPSALGFTPVTAQPVGYPAPAAFPQFPPAYQQPSTSALNAPPPPPPPPPVYSGPSIPPGLEYLTVVDQLIVKQKVDVLEVMTGFETNNKYDITNNMGQKVYSAVEENDCCTRNCCGSIRPFDIRILDNNRMDVMRIHRPCRCDGCCFPCCLQELQVTSRSGQLLGSVKQNWSLWSQKFSVKDPVGGTVLKIRGPVCPFSCFGTDVDFDVLSLVGEHKVGRISKKWGGVVRELCTDADTFGVSFPMDLNVYTKAVLLAATFLIDFMFFENDCDD